MTTQEHSALVKTSTSLQHSYGVSSTTTSSMSDKTTPQSPSSYIEEYWAQPVPSVVTPRKDERNVAMFNPNSTSLGNSHTPKSEPMRHNPMVQISPTRSASSTPSKNPNSQLKLNLGPVNNSDTQEFSGSPVKDSSRYTYSSKINYSLLSPSVHTLSSGERNKHKAQGGSIDSDVVETSKIVVDYDPTTGNKTINKYMIIKEIGRGCHGKVKLCRDTETGILYAIKIVEKFSRRRLGQRQDQSSSLNKIRKEIAILKKCRHPHVVRLHEVIDDPEAKKIYLVLEYVDGGDMKWRDENDRPILSLETSRQIFRDVVLGLEYLHHQGIIHRDIKPANLLRTKDGVVKISDFGVSYFSRNRKSLAFQPHLHMENGKNLATKDSRSSSSLQSINEDESTESFHTSYNSISEADESNELELAKTAGSPAFFAPELCFPGEEYLDIPTSEHQNSSVGTPTLQDRRSSSGSRASILKPPITKAIDVWALGVTLYCLVFGRCPFMAETEYELFHLIPKKPLEFPDDIPIPDTLKDLLERLLEKDPLKRMTLEEAKRHPWVIEDLPNPDQWCQETNPCKYKPLEVTEDEVKKAVTFKDRIKKHIRKLSSSISHVGASLGFRRKSKTGLE